MPTPEILRESKPSKVTFKAAPEAAVVSVSRRYAVGGHGCRSAELSARVGLILEELGAVVKSGGGFIGHIKAFIATPDGASLGLSVVRDRARPQGAGFAPEEPVIEFKVAVTAIIYGCPKDELNRLVELALAVGLPRSFCVPAGSQKLSPLNIMAPARSAPGAA